MHRRTVHQLSLAASIALIVAATLLPFEGLQSDRVPTPWCLTCEGRVLSDALSNVVLFVPLGVALASLGAAWTRVTGVAMLASLGIECLQSLGLPPMRSAAVADVVTNALGGFVGAWLFRLRRPFFLCAPRAALQLASAWTLAAALTFGLTSVALGTRTRAVEIVSYQPSRLSHTPGFGWFSGLVDSASVNGFVTSPRGTGPVIVEVAGEPDQVEMFATIRGRQAGSALKPMVFLHRTGDSSAIAFLAERDVDAELVVTRRAVHWGLTMPSLRLAGAFATRSEDDARPLQITALATTDRLHLSASAVHFTGSRTLWLTPALGWTMIQTLITIDSPFAVVARVGWLALLVVPLAWWSARAGRQWRTVLLAAVVCLLLVLASLPRLTGVAPVAVVDFGVMAALLLVATLCSRRELSRVAPAEPGTIGDESP